MNLQKIAEYGGRILPDGILEMRDPNDNAKHRYQYAWRPCQTNLRAFQPSRRVLPDEGDYDPPASWWPYNLAELAAQGGYNPILDYFASAKEEA